MVDNSYKLNLLSLIQIYCSTILLPYIKGEQYIEINQMNIGRNKHPNANNDMGENKLEDNKNLFYDYHLKGEKFYGKCKFIKPVGAGVCR